LTEKVLKRAGLAEHAYRPINVEMTNMKTRYMEFEVTAYEVPSECALMRVFFGSVTELRSFVHMVSVDKPRIPILFIHCTEQSLLEYKSKHERSFTMYFAIFDGVMYIAYERREGGENERKTEEQRAGNGKEPESSETVTCVPDGDGLL
jgi:hypothetical protein